MRNEPNLTNNNYYFRELPLLNVLQEHSTDGGWFTVKVGIVLKFIAEYFVSNISNMHRQFPPNWLRDDKVISLFEYTQTQTN